MLPRCVILIDVDSSDLQIIEQTQGLEQNEAEARIVGDSWGKITSLSYAAKAAGINRNEDIETAIAKCPTLKLLRFPLLKTGKPDYTGRRLMTQRLMESIQAACPGMPLELSSPDEFYVDLTSELHRRITSGQSPPLEELWTKTIFEGGGTTMISDFGTISDQSDLILLHGAVMASNLIRRILAQVRIRTSVGLAHNKMVAKLACGANKPAALTIVSGNGGLVTMSKKISVRAVPGLGHGKAGGILATHYASMYDFSMASVEDIVEITNQLISAPRAARLLEKCKGNCTAKVVPTTYFNSVNVTKTFPDETNLTKLQLCEYLEGLCDELVTRIQEEIAWNRRTAKTLTVSIKLENHKTEGIRLLENVATLSSSQISTDVWDRFQYAHLKEFKVKRIEMVIKRFDPVQTSDPRT